MKFLAACNLSSVFRKRHCHQQGVVQDRQQRHIQRIRWCPRGSFPGRRYRTLVGRGEVLIAVLIGRSGPWSTRSKTMSRVISTGDPNLPSSQARLTTVIRMQTSFANLMHPNTSLDEVFDRVVVPILVTYDSRDTLNHSRDCTEYASEFGSPRYDTSRGTLKNKLDTKLPVDVRLFLVPLADKARCSVLWRKRSTSGSNYRRSTTDP